MIYRFKNSIDFFSAIKNHVDVHGFYINFTNSYCATCSITKMQFIITGNRYTMGDDNNAWNEKLANMWDQLETIRPVNYAIRYTSFCKLLIYNPIMIKLMKMKVFL